QVLTAELLRFGEDFELDLRAYELRRGGRVLKLERIPMDLLLLLIERRGELVTREQIVERIWGKGVFLDTDNSINSAIRKIRQVLKTILDNRASCKPSLVAAIALSRLSSATDRQRPRRAGTVSHYRVRTSAFAFRTTACALPGQRWDQALL